MTQVDLGIILNLIFKIFNFDSIDKWEFYSQKAPFSWTTISLV